MKQTASTDELNTSTESSPYSRAARNPRKWFYWAFFGQVLAIIISGILFGAGYSIFPNRWDGVILDVSQDSSAVNTHAWNAILNDNSNNLFSAKLPTQSERSIPTLPLTILFQSAANCLTQTNLASMKTMEDYLLSVSLQNGICQLSGAACAKPDSVLRLFDGTFVAYDNKLRADTEFARISEIIQTAYALNGGVTGSSPNLRVFLDAVLSSDLDINAPSATVCRATFNSGLPLASYRTSQSDQPRQLETLRARHLDTFRSYLASHTTLGDLNVYYSSEPLDQYAEQRARHVGFYLTIGSLLVLFFALWIYTSSLWLVSGYILHLLCSFAWANLVYRIVTNFHVFGVYQALNIYVVVAVSLVQFIQLVTSWKSEACRSITHATARVAYVHQVCKRPLLLTTMTSMLSMFVSASSPLLMIMSVDTFGGILLFTNYLSMVTFIPTVFLLWVDPHAGALTTSTSSPTTTVNLDNAQSVVEVPAHQKIVKRPKKSAYATFIETKFIDEFLAARLFRWILSACFIVLVVAFLLIAIIGLSLDRHQPHIFKSSTNERTFASISERSFVVTSDNTQLYLVFGLTTVDRTSCDRTNFDCDGTPVYDEYFDLTPFAVQNALLNVCNGLSGLNSGNTSQLAIRRSRYVDSANHFPVDMQCFLQQLKKTYAQASLFPFDISSMETIVGAQPSRFPPSAYQAIGSIGGAATATYYRSFEIALEDWFMSDSTSIPYLNFMGGLADQSLTRTDSGLTNAGRYGDTLRYVAITVDLTLNSQDLSYEVGQPIKDQWDAYVENIKKSSPVPLQTVFHATPVDQTWSWLAAQQTFFRSIFQGLALSMLLAFFVLALGTNNWLLGLFTCGFVGFVVVMIFGIVQLAGYNLGFFESLHFTAVIAIAMAYFVPLTCAYATATAVDKLERARKALQVAGPAITIGGIIFLMCSVFLFGAPLVGMYEYAMFVFFTSLISIVFSLVFFAFILTVLGPERFEGEVSVRLRPASKSHVIRPSISSAKRPASAQPTTTAATAPIELIAVETRPVGSEPTPAPEAQPTSAPKAKPLYQVKVDGDSDSVSSVSDDERRRPISVKPATTSV